ncbi:MAG: hypothetical protein GY701_32875 [Sulfitobacter sp.]|nr:hypothetical protein [Sulfitobacter sp.]
MEVMLEESIERLAAISEVFGFAGPQRLDGRAGDRELEKLQRATGPYRVPSELSAWWKGWDPASTAVLADTQIQLLTVERALEEWEFLRELEYPRLLLPVGREEKRLLCVELGTDSHLGSRLFELGFHGENLTLLGVGVSAFIDLIVESLERTRSTGSVNQYPGAIDWEIYAQICEQAHREFGSVRFDEHNRTEWPAHWLEVAGFNQDWLRPRGRTHTAFEFDAAREQSWPLTGVLQGVYRTQVGGGPLYGAVGRLTDLSGFVQVFIPNGCPHAGLGPNGQCEIEVVGVPQNGEGPGSLPSGCEALAAALSGNEQEQLEWFERLFAATKALDVSIVATAVRPLS